MTQLPATNASADSGEIDYLQIALRHKLLLLAGLISGTALGHFVYQQLGPEYVATGKILVSKKASVQLREGESQDAGGRGEHIALIMSPLIVEKAVELGRLNELPSMRKSKDVVEDIVTSLKVQRSAGQDTSVLNVLDITYKATNRDDAKKVVDAIIQAYDEFLGEIHRKRITELTKHIAEANGSLRDQIHNTERDYEAFRAQAPIHLKSQTRGPAGERAGSASNIHQENLEVLDKERQQLLLRKSELLSQIQSIEGGLANGQSREELSASIQLFNTSVRAPQDANAAGGSASSGLNALNPLAIANGNQPRPENSSLESQWIALKLQHEQLTLNYGPDWPAIETIKRQLALIEWQFRQKGLKLPSEAIALQPNALAGSPTTPGTVAVAPKADLVSLYISSLRQQLDVVMRREMEISRVYSVEFDNARQLARYVEQDRRFHDDLDRMNGLWNVVREQAAKVDLLKDNREFTLQSISPIRDQLSVKRLLKLYGAGYVTMLTLTCGLIALFEMRRRKIDITNTAAAPNTVAASLPVQTQPAVSIPFASLGSIPQFLATSENGSLKPDAALCVHHRSNSVEANAFRATAQALLAQVPHTPAIVQITSAVRGEGNSLVTANLGLAIAETGKRVLVIDADFAKPVQHELFGLRNDVGLVDVLSGELDLLTAARPTVVVGLHVLPTSTTNFDLDVSTDAFRHLLSDARREFDVVLIDSPNFKTSKQSDLIAQRVDHAVFVWCPERANSDLVQSAVSRLQQSVCTVIGAIATQCQPENASRLTKPTDLNAPLDPAAFRALAKA